MSIFSSRTSLVLTLGLLAAASATVAEPVQVRTGLWAQSQITTINGKAMPMPNVGQGAAAQEMQRIQQLAKQYGLPEGGIPELSCERKGVYDVHEMLAKDKMASECKFDILEQRRDGARFAMRCQMPQGGVATGTGEATIVNGTEARMTAKYSAVVQGQPLNLETKSVSKWIGGDCAHPPAGIDPNWISEGESTGQ